MYLKIVLLTFHQTFIDNFLLQYKHWYSIKSSLKFVYSRKYSQFLYLHLLHYHVRVLHLNLSTPLEKLLTRFDNELVIILALSINCNHVGCIFCNLFFLMYFSVFSLIQGNLFFKFFWYLFYNKMIIIVRSIMKSYWNFFRYTIF